MAASSRAGTTIGGWLTIRYRPSTSSPSLESACRLSRVCAFSRVFSAVFSALLAAFASCLPFAFFLAAFVVSATAPRTAFMTSSSARCAYQMSIVRISANSAIACRYADTDASVDARASAGENPLLRAAIVKLAAIRFTSYSNGPGSVSSKSFRSNSSLRSGEANTPKFDRWASPHSWAIKARRRRALEVGGHDLRRTPVEGEGRDHHPAVADGHEVGLSGECSAPRAGRPGQGGPRPDATPRGSTAASGPRRPFPWPCGRPRWDGQSSQPASGHLLFESRYGSAIAMDYSVPLRPPTTAASSRVGSVGPRFGAGGNRGRPVRRQLDATRGFRGCVGLAVG